MDIKDLKEHLDTASAEMKDLVNRQSEEIKAHQETSKETAAKIEKADALILEMKAEAEAKEARLVEVEKRMNRPDFGKPQQRKSLGQQFATSDVYEEIKAAGFRGNSRGFECKDISGGSASAGSLVPEFRVPEIFANPDRPLFVRNLVRNTPVQGDSVTIMRELAFTNAAAAQAGQLVAKPKSDITYQAVTLPVETQAHYFIASRQVLSDAPRLAGMIDQRSEYGLNLLMDAQLLYGDGTGNNFTGLFVDADINDVGEIASGTTAAELPGAMIDHIRAAITKNQLAEFYSINGLVLNPEDWQAIETAKGSDGHYIWVNVTQGGEQRMWRVPVVVSNAVAKSDFILGDWQMGSTLYGREGITIRTSESHADLFIKNGVAILAEERNAFAIELPKAYTKGKFTVAV